MGNRIGLRLLITFLVVIILAAGLGGRTALAEANESSEYTTLDPNVCAVIYIMIFIHLAYTIVRLRTSVPSDKLHPADEYLDYVVNHRHEYKWSHYHLAKFFLSPIGMAQLRMYILFGIIGEVFLLVSGSGLLFGFRGHPVVYITLVLGIFVMCFALMGWIMRVMARFANWMYKKDGWVRYGDSFSRGKAIRFDYNRKRGWKKEVYTQDDPEYYVISEEMRRSKGDGP